MNKKTRKLSLSRETLRAMSDVDLHVIQGAELTANPRMCSLGSCPGECSLLTECCP